MIDRIKDKLTITKVMVTAILILLLANYFLIVHIQEELDKVIILEEQVMP